jgi:hypothetical protein
VCLRLCLSVEVSVFGCKSGDSECAEEGTETRALGVFWGFLSVFEGNEAFSSHNRAYGEGLDGGIFPWCSLQASETPTYPTVRPE